MRKEDEGGFANRKKLQCASTLFERPQLSYFCNFVGDEGARRNLVISSRRAASLRPGGPKPGNPFQSKANVAASLPTPEGLSKAEF